MSRRPLFVLGSLWLVTICVAAVAVQRLVFTNPEQATATAQSQVQSSRTATGAPSENRPLGEGAHDAATEDGIVPPRQNTKVTFWGLSSLVGLCALGSWVITLRAKVAARRRPKRRVRRMKPKAAAPTGPKRLRPYSPDRDAIIVKGARAVVDTLPLTLADADADINFFDDFDDPVRVVQGIPPNSVSFRSHPAAQGQRPPQPIPSAEVANEVSKLREPRAVPPQPSATPAQPTTQVDSTSPHQPEVLPQEEAHPLDWDEESLAHALDLRQRRSLSSLM